MNYPSIRIEGAILSPDLLDRIEEHTGQRPSDFNLHTASKVKDEIARAWADAQDYWRIFQRKLESIRNESLATTETRQQWMVPLLGLLGYQLDYQTKAAIIQDKTYAISHRAANRGQTPVHIVGYNDPAGLDRKPDRTTGPRMSAHALVQEYLNLADELYALVTNGRILRLLRDSSRLIKLSYLEFDLDRIFTDGLFADFAILYRLLHASRMPASVEAASESLIEHYHQDSLDSGARIRDGLSKAVEEAIQSFANGLLSHPANANLKAQVESGNLKAEDFYQNLLRLIYRILFLLVIEERNLVYPLSPDKAKQQIYYSYYSLQRLRRLSEKRYLADPRQVDLWHALLNCFRLFEARGPGHMLGIAPLAGDLFNAEAIGPINSCLLDNETVLGCLRSLNVYHNKDTQQTIRVNYAALNVEEFGSVYEGLLEYRPVFFQQGSRWEFAFEYGDDRANTGSHYTPDDLVQPLIKHSLDYLIADKLKEADKEAALLSLRVADIACGSGHILLAAARRIGTELAIIRTGEEQPSPLAMRLAIRDVIQNCIYGVDLNPLAVELCKVALWLEAHVPGKPLNFLDHHIKCGNSIVGFVRQEELEQGVPDEAFKTLPDDDKDTAAYFRQKNKSERKSDKRQTQLGLSPELQQQIDAIRRRWDTLSRLPECTPQEIEQKKSSFQAFTNSKDEWLLEQIACIPIAQFYTPKTPEHKAHLITDEDYREFLSGRRTPQGQATAHAWALADRKKFFHWFLQFPEIIQRGGFDCILGNPPYLGGKKVSTAYGKRFHEYILKAFEPSGSMDLVGFFFRRAFELLRSDGFQALLATKTISQGDTREYSIEQILKKGGSIPFAAPVVKWPGKASVFVSLVSIKKGSWKAKAWLGKDEVSSISSFLDSGKFAEPFSLEANQDLSFVGSFVCGAGFILPKAEAEEILQRHPGESQVIVPYFNGNDITGHPQQETDRYAINFHDYTEEVAKNYPHAYKIALDRVKPQRTEKKEDGAFKLRKPLPQRWWQYADKRPKLYRKLNEMSAALVIPETSKYFSFSLIPVSGVFSHMLKVIVLEDFSSFSCLSSNLHEAWAWRYSSTLGAAGLRYMPSVVFETFPRVGFDGNCEHAGRCYHQQRKYSMELLGLGLTKIYNLFHAPDLSPKLVTEVSKKTAAEAEAGYHAILKLRELHRELDQAVLAAYGWTDLDLGHDFYDQDYLPENDRTRYTISPTARYEVLQRLLKLNHEHHAEELAATEASKATKKITRKRTKPIIDIEEDDLFKRVQRSAEALMQIPSGRRVVMSSDDYLLEVIPAIIGRCENSRIRWDTFTDAIRLLARPHKLKKAAVGEDVNLVEKWEKTGKQDFALEEVMDVIQVIGGETIAIERHGSERFLRLKVNWPQTEDWPAYDAWLALRVVNASMVMVPFETDETQLLNSFDQIEALLA